jgi:archaellin
MSNWSTGITTMILLISFLLIGITVASVITGETTGTTTEQDYDHMTEEIINEISSYIQIRDQKGKYCTDYGGQKILEIGTIS